MRTIVRTAIITDAELLSLGVVPTGVLSGNIDTPGVKPFLNLKWGETLPGVSAVTRTTLVIWIHDNPNDYGLIDRIRTRLRDLLTSLEGVYDADSGGWVNVVDWVSDSSDLFDEGHRTIVKQSVFTITGNN